MGANQRWRPGAVVFLAASLVATGLVGSDSPRSQVVAAFAHLSGPDAIYPEGKGSREDQRALDVLRAHPRETRAVFVAAFSKGGQRGRARVQRMMFELPPGEILPATRQILATYPIGDPATPLLGWSIAFGEAQDMARLKQEIAFAPDSARNVQWAKVMARSHNDAAHAALWDLRRGTPGAWQASPELIAYFANTSPPMDNTWPIFVLIASGVLGAAMGVALWVRHKRA